MLNKKYVIFAYIFPIFVLFAAMIYYSHLKITGTEAVFRITGYDPRDILSGHFVVYSVDYGVKDLCAADDGDGYIVVSDDGNYFISVADYDQGVVNGNVVIKGQCASGRFIAGVEKYFIPEDKSVEYDRKIRDSEARVVLSISSDGKAVVKKIIFDE